ncbi:MAG: cation transporter, partial [Clostridia bacterium]|nr:cation transporter [Clostridia bacterium]
KSRLSDVPAAVRLSRATLTNIHENLFWVFIYNVIGIPLAAGAFTGLFGWSMNPMFGAAAMSLSSFCVVSNALRLNFFRLDRPGRGTKEAGPAKARVSQLQPENLLLRVAVGGMMCSHCEATVKAALEAIPGVVSASASHEAGSATILAEKPLDESLIRKAIEAEDYEYKGIIHD